MGKRYTQLLQLIDVFRPRSILEIGTFNGHNAVRMITQAQKYNPEIMYVGYDLFENATAETDAAEFNVKPHNSIKDVSNDIKHGAPNSAVSLVKGNTRETLKPIHADFAFIDGGHSIETIAHDYEAVRSCAVVVLDDYYVPDNDGKCPDISTMGCNQLVKGLKHVVLPRKDPVQGGGLVQMVLVVNT